jgi:hypothetical protein
VISRKLLYGLVGMSISAFGPGALGTALGQTADYVYVETNLNPANSIRVFSRAASGQLKEIAGSPFATGGAGSGYNGVAVGPEQRGWYWALPSAESPNLGRSVLGGPDRQRLLTD